MGSEPEYFDRVDLVEDLVHKAMLDDGLLQLPGTAGDRSRHSGLDGLSHAGDGCKIQRFLDGVSVLQGNQDSGIPLAGDVDGGVASATSSISP